VWFSSKSLKLGLDNIFVRDAPLETPSRTRKNPQKRSTVLSQRVWLWTEPFAMEMARQRLCMPVKGVLFI